MGSRVVPKFSFLATSCSGTGGGRRIVRLSDYLVRNGYEVDVHTQMGSDADMRALSAANFCPTLQGVSGDIVVCFDAGVKNQVLDEFMNCKASTKVFYFLLWHEEYQPVVDDKSIIRIATTSYLAKRGSAIPIIGPVDVWNFTAPPVNMRRNPIMLVYLKKCGWVGVRTFRILRQAKPEFMLASLGMDGLNHDIVRSRQMEWPEVPVLDFGVPAHRTDLLQFPYSKSAVFVASDSAGNWGVNSCLSEAMLCMCPVVATDWEGFSDTIIPGYTALTVPAREASEYCDGYVVEGDRVLRTMQTPTRPDPTKLAARVLEVLEDVDLRMTLTRQARDHVLKFDYDYWFNAFASAVDL